VAVLSAPLAAAFRRLDVRVAAAIVAAPLLLLVARLLPADGVGLGLRLFLAGLCVLVVPGAVLLRAFAWPAAPALAFAAAFVLSLAIAFVAFAITFAVGGSPVLVVAAVAAITLAAAVPAVRARPDPAERAETLALAAVVAAGVAFGAVVWWATQTVGTGDALMHIARSRKLAEADVLSSVDVANEYRDGGLHPGYAFPLWHGVVALAARLAGIDVATTTLHLSALLVPVAFVAAYAAGRALFDSWAGGVATLAAQVAQLGFSRAGVGSFDSLALPASATRILLVPILLALAFACLRGASRGLLVPLAAAALAVAIVHPTYLIFVAIPLAAFAAAWLAFRRERRGAAVAAGTMLAAVLVPAGAFFLWLLPVIRSTASHAPTASEEARAIAHYGAQLQVVGDAYRAAPDAITRAGPVVVAGLLVLPLLALAIRRAWALFAVAGTLVVLAILLVPELFTRFSDLVSISQSRRLAQFLPVPFAVAGGAVLAGRLRLAGVALALGVGVALELLYSAELTHVVETGGPVWPLWVAALATPLALAAALVLRRRWTLTAEPTRWAAAAALAFVAPVAVVGLANVERAEALDRYALTPGLVDALDRLPDQDVVFAPVETSYRIPAFANVYVAATPPPHAADTEENRPYRRQRDVIRFFAPRSPLTDDDRRALLGSYGAGWVVVDKSRAFPKTFLEPLERVYEDGRYALLRVPSR
jgi:hypothetical protein